MSKFFAHAAWIVTVAAVTQSCAPAVNESDPSSALPVLTPEETVSPAIAAMPPVTPGARVPTSCETTQSPGCGVVEITGGTFQLGQLGAHRNNNVVTPVTVSDYALDAYEVSVARFRRFWEAGHPGVSAPIPYSGGHTLTWYSPSAFNSEAPAVQEPGQDTRCTWTPTAGANESLPVNCVDYYTAQAFCVWDGGRLPTEAEWEYAARGRSVDGMPSGRTFPWGDDRPASEVNRPCDRANTHCGDSPDAVTPVGSFAATAGFFDLAGNVAEWSADYGMSYMEDLCWYGIPRTDPLCGRGSEWSRGTFPTRGGSTAVLNDEYNPEQVDLWPAAARYMRRGTEQSPETGMRCARNR